MNPHKLTAVLCCALSCWTLENSATTYYELVWDYLTKEADSDEIEQFCNNYPIFVDQYKLLKRTVIARKNELRRDMSQGRRFKNFPDLPYTSIIEREILNADWSDNFDHIKFLVEMGVLVSDTVLDQLLNKKEENKLQEKMSPRVEEYILNSYIRPPNIMSEQTLSLYISGKIPQRQ